MGINALTVAWISRLASKSLIPPGTSIIEFGPQDLVHCSRTVVELHGLRHNPRDVVAARIQEIFENDQPRPSGAAAFYQLFGIARYRSVDLIDPRADWKRDMNRAFRLPERFELATNFGTAEHIFNVAANFQSMHDALKPGGSSLFILPAFGDVDHGFYNVHPTTYLDIAAVNDYTVEDFCYVDRWDVRNEIYDADPISGIDFDSMPIRLTDMKDRSALQRTVAELYVANFLDPLTQRYKGLYPGLVYDYCCVALRKTKSGRFRYPVQRYYWQGGRPEHTPTEKQWIIAIRKAWFEFSKAWLEFSQEVRGYVKWAGLLADAVRTRGALWLVGAVYRRIARGIGRTTNAVRNRIGQ